MAELSKPQVTVAAEILAQATSLASFSEGVADRTQNRLADVMRVEPPTGGGDGDEAPTYPKFFTDLRIQLWRIEAQLRRIDGYMGRTEL